ncbi:universal stress protein [Catenulispora rubra]|uniref:universal stress protein n=1 Tax=Catenulispora rubra TaxID=280293 RepID=UPI0018921E1F|nr:universal stress protein [Catenulispora rubra]
MKTTVVVGYDQTPHSEVALEQAAREAATRGATLNVVTAFRRPDASGSAPSPQDTDPEDTARKTAGAVAQHGVDRVRERHPQVQATPYALVGPAGKIIAQAAHSADLLVLGSRGQGGFTGLQVGSTSMRALADACCPVLVVRGEPDVTHERIVAAVDIDDYCEPVLDFAFAEASRRGVRITVIHVWDEPWIVSYGQQDPGITDDIALIERERDDRLSALIQSVQRRYPEVQSFHEVAAGSAGRLLVEAAERADLIVTGARRHGEGRHGMQIGPVTQTLLHYAACPIAVVPLP